MSAIHELLSGMSPAAAIVISIAFMLFLGFAMTRLTKLLRLPNVTAYIVTGILIGPFCLDLIPANVIDGMDFLSDIALAFIAFSTGEFFRFSVLKKNGPRVVIITLLEASAASILVFVATYYLLGVNLVFSAILAALAAATAPTATMMIIRQTGAKGDYVNTLLQTVALDDMLGLVSYSMVISVAMASRSGDGFAFGIGSVFKPLLINVGILLLGALFGVLLKLLMPKKRSTDNRLIIGIATLFAFCGVCVLLDVSPLLGCMSMGTVYINISGDEKLFKQLNYFSPPILLLFFVRSGLCFRLDAMAGTSSVLGGISLPVIAIVYFVTRALGKYGGAFLGCLLAKKPRATRNCLGMALIPQASVVIGLAALGARMLGGEEGSALQTVILASSVLGELIGPALAKFSLSLAGAYSDKLEDMAQVEELTADGKKKTAVDMLVERIAKIQSGLPQHTASEEEEAFTEAAEEQYQIKDLNQARRFPRNRR